jgi:hypothetical protein
LNFQETIYSQMASTMFVLKKFQWKSIFNSHHHLKYQFNAAISHQSFCNFRNTSVTRQFSSSSFPGATEGLKVEVTKTTKTAVVKDTKLGSKCGPDQSTSAETDEDEMEEMFIMGPAGVEWGGPTRGGARPEPTRYGDWERKGRASDF